MEATLSRQQRKQLRKERRKQDRHEPPKPVGLSLRPLKPLNTTQERVFDSYYSGKHMVLAGTAGTGKTFLSMYLTLQEVLDSDQYEALTVVRSTEPVKDQGFLPGSIKEKQKVYELPYQAICGELFGRGDAYDVLKHKGKVEFLSTSFVRGVTFRDRIVLVDEIQNLTPSECNTIITRVGENCRILFAGDLRQTDLVKGRGVSGFRDFMEVLKRMNHFDFIEFKPVDIVRSSMVKEYILTRDLLEDQGLVRPLA